MKESILGQYQYTHTHILVLYVTIIYLFSFFINRFTFNQAISGLPSKNVFVYTLTKFVNLNNKLK